MNTLKERIEDLNNMILGGDILGAFDKYYGEEIVQQDNDTEPRTGFKACRAFEESFVANLTEFRGAKVRNVMVSEDAGVAAIEWDFDYTHKEWGVRTYTQVAIQRWKDGKIVSEKFVYNG